MAKIVSLLFKLARLAADAQAISKGPKAMARRAGNKAIGRKVGSKIYLKGRKR